MNRRIGKFKVAMLWLDEPNAPNILDRCLVLNVEHDFARQVITYTAIHPDFAEVREGCECEEYVGVFVDGRRSPYWEPR